MVKVLILFFLGLVWSTLLFIHFASIENRATAEEALRHLKGLLYQEAALHNPQGDVLPDEIDDKFWNRLRNFW